VQDVRTALKKMAATHSTRTLQKGHNCLTRAVRHAEGQDLVRRNVALPWVLAAAGLGPTGPLIWTGREAVSAPTPSPAAH
jgi:hypothetical protein